MRFSIGLPRLVDFRRGAPPPHPLIVTERHADPVEMVYQAFRRLDFDERQRVRSRIARAPP
jgi:hypothetical protein